MDTPNLPQVPTAIACDVDLPLTKKRKYALGGTAHELSTGYSWQIPLQRLDCFPIAQLVEQATRTAHLDVMHGREVIYVVEERTKRPTYLVTNPGVRLPAHLTARVTLAVANRPAPKPGCRGPHYRRRHNSGEHR